jgi:hypothetical protein
MKNLQMETSGCLGVFDLDVAPGRGRGASLVECACGGPCLKFPTITDKERI